MPIKLPKEPVRNSLTEPRPGTNYGYENLTMDPASRPRQHVEVPDWHFENVSMDVPVSVARNALHKEMDVLRHRIAAAENGASVNPFQFVGNGDPYMAEMMRQHQVMSEMAKANTEILKGQLEKLESLAADADIVRWAVDNAKVARHVNGGWVSV